MEPSVDVGHPREALVVHGVSGLCMAVMIIAAVPGWAASVGLVAFGSATAWCLLQALRRCTPALHLRLALCCVAMVAMLVPHLAAQPHSGPMAGGAAMHGSTMAGAPTLAALVVAGALLVVATVLATRTRTVVWRGHRRPARPTSWSRCWPR